MESEYKYDNYSGWQKIIIWFFFISGIVFLLIFGLSVMDNSPEGIQEIAKIVFATSASEQFIQNHHTFVSIYVLFKWLPVIIMIIVTSNILGDKYVLFKLIGIGNKTVGNPAIQIFFAILIEILTFAVAVYFNFYDFISTFLYEIVVVILMFGIITPAKLIK